MKEKDFDVITEDDEIFEDLNDLGAFDVGGKREKKFNQTEDDVEYIEQNLWSKLERVGKKISFAKDIFALYKYMKDPFIAWYRKAIVVAALVYFISPVDTIPDIAPLIGYLDDLGVITALIKYLGSELIPYYDKEFRA